MKGRHLLVVGHEICFFHIQVSYAHDLQDTVDLTGLKRRARMMQAVQTSSANTIDTVKDFVMLGYYVISVSGTFASKSLDFIRSTHIHQ